LVRDDSAVHTQVARQAQLAISVRTEYQLTISVIHPDPVTAVQLYPLAGLGGLDDRTDDGCRVEYADEAGVGGEGFGGYLACLHLLGGDLRGPDLLGNHLIHGSRSGYEFADLQCGDGVACDLARIPGGTIPGPLARDLPTGYLTPHGTYGLAFAVRRGGLGCGPGDAGHGRELVVQLINRRLFYHGLHGDHDTLGHVGAPPGLRPAHQAHMPVAHRQPARQLTARLVSEMPQQPGI